MALLENLIAMFLEILFYFFFKLLIYGQPNMETVRHV